MRNSLSAEMIATNLPATNFPVTVLTCILLVQCCLNKKQTNLISREERHLLGSLAICFAFNRLVMLNKASFNSGDKRFSMIIQVKKLKIQPASKMLQQQNLNIQQIVIKNSSKKISIYVV